MSHALTLRTGFGVLPSRVQRWVSTMLVLAASLTAGHAVHAYPWMIRDGYQECKACHVDPAGSGVLTQYGRGLGEIRLAMPWGPAKSDPTPTADFLFGAIEVPEPLLLGGQLRVLQLAHKVEGAELRQETVWMQLDFAAAVATERFVASATLGYAPDGATNAALTRGPSDNLVSRQHWLGVRLLPDVVLLRAGRMNLPFGLRSIEHTLWARALTRTSINDDQQHGIALSLETPRVRGEVMAIVGNFQLRPSAYRERGYSAYVEVPLAETLALGASSLLTHRQLDPRYLNKTFRQAHGLMARWVTPHSPLVLLSEWNYVLESPRWGQWRKGLVGYAQADYEPTQGLHLMLTAEANDVGVSGTPFALGTWLSAAWFFATHADLRIDAVYQTLPAGPTRIGVLALLAQAHVYL